MAGGERSCESENQGPRCGPGRTRPPCGLTRLSVSARLEASVRVAQRCGVPRIARCELVHPTLARLRAKMASPVSSSPLAVDVSTCESQNVTVRLATREVPSTTFAASNVDGGVAYLRAPPTFIDIQSSRFANERTVVSSAQMACGASITESAVRRPPLRA